MKIPSETLDLVRDSDLRTKSQKPPRRKSRSPAGVRLKRVGAPAGRRSRPETPEKFHGGDKCRNGDGKEGRLWPEAGRSSGRELSSRELAAVLWRLRLPEVAGSGGERSSLPKNGRLGLQYGASHTVVPFLGHQTHHNSRAHSSGGKDLMQSPRSISGPRNGYMYKFEPLLRFSNPAMEGATKWDTMCLKTADEVQLISDRSKHLDREANAVSAISALKVELKQAKTRIHELETERQSSKKKLEHFLKKLSEERATWRSREHEKIRVIIDDIKSDLNRERKNRQRLEMVNSKMVNELADVKLLSKRYMQEYEKEKKARELLEEVCDELAKEIGEDKTAVEDLKRESMKLREEVNEERKMLQMAEVWREERVQMKLVDAKVMVAEKYSQMNKLVADLETFLSLRNEIPDGEETRKAEFLRKAAAAVNIQAIKEFAYVPPNPNEIFSVFEDVNCREANERREIGDCSGSSHVSCASKVRTMSREANMFNEDRLLRPSNSCFEDSGDMDEDESGWETVSHVDDQGSSSSPEGSNPSVNKIGWEDNACEYTQIAEIREVTEFAMRNSKTVPFGSRILKSCPNSGDNCKIIAGEGMLNGRISNGSRLSSGASMSPDRGSGKGTVSPQVLVGHWSSPELGNPQITQGVKGRMEWPRGVQKSSLKAKLLEARIESQKMQLHQVLKQKS
ncbi:hypothetical protein RHMOL_Rhmol04G0022100 [Rhododendron molle]|uniref:Uncharacterized protein n=1 Tax=Rhododendron molle TaxID=49168 RepID=A0ACC0NXW3_RHOML|nr:hypothetical protein RHMOL_Rhmol04G0022100 [Rhododendron molle]